ncbi:hypothetical protein ACFQ3H_12615, partial [Paralysiella testudinis]|uniref:hypothetical protein n=1 Tax=Paralysiella testudinis TaxID=2809020 RepID=UPI003633B9F5
RVRTSFYACVSFLFKGMTSNCEQTLDHYNSLTLKETLSKFLVDIEPNANQPDSSPDNGRLDSPSI